MTLSNQTVKKIMVGKEELANLQTSVQNMASLQDYVKANAADLKQIDTLFPNEDDFVYVLQDIEGVVKATDPEGSVKVGAPKPTKSQNQNTLPLSIKLKTDTNGTITFLRQFERLPYIIQISSLELKSHPESPDQLEISLTVRLHVAEPFSS
jgi:Tfp pilus assembly protein PilO